MNARNIVNRLLEDEPAPQTPDNAERPPQQKHQRPPLRKPVTQRPAAPPQRAPQADQRPPEKQPAKPVEQPAAQPAAAVTAPTEQPGEDADQPNANEFVQDSFKTYRLGSSSLINAPSIVAYAKNLYMGKGKAKKQAMEILKSWPGMPLPVVTDVLNGKLKFTIDYKKQAVVIVVPKIKEYELA